MAFWNKQIHRLKQFYWDDFFQWYFFLLSFSEDFFQGSICYLTKPKQKQLIIGEAIW